jgi:transcriptional regulator with XRE-family HTH domain
MEANALVAWNLRRLRVARGISQEQLAVDAGIDRTYVGGIERGKENPTVLILERLAAALESRITELFREPRVGSRPPRALPGGRRRAVKSAIPIRSAQRK